MPTIALTGASRTFCWFAALTHATRRSFASGVRTKMNRAGVEFAVLVRKKPDLLDHWRLEFSVEDFVPKIEGLKDGLSADQFRDAFGSVGDERFIRAVADIRKRIRALPGHGGRDR